MYAIKREFRLTIGWRRGAGLILRSNNHSRTYSCSLLLQTSIQTTALKRFIEHPETWSLEAEVFGACSQV